jgi:methylase of polypeptide subunit release factors
LNTEAELEAACRALPKHLRAAIARGQDPLGEAFARIRDKVKRRAHGAVYTPPSLIARMFDWSASVCTPARVVDPGCGSGRFLLAAARRFPNARLLGVDVDPLAVAMTRANLRAAGCDARSDVRIADYTTLALPTADGTTLFIGNPPYVRHHQIASQQKRWLKKAAATLGQRASRLAGLHSYFFLATVLQARAGDVGCFVTSSEWLDTGYGELIRSMLRQTLTRLERFDPKIPMFSDAMTTAVITGFQIGSKSSRFEFADNSGTRTLDRKRLDAPRWSTLARKRSKTGERVPLGTLFRVSRGQATGNNRVFVIGPDTPPVPARFCRPTITRARELLDASFCLSTLDHLRRVIDLPAAFDEKQVVAFLDWARAHGAHESYLARHRNPWWAIKLPAPAPILVTYMARRPPVFVENPLGARHLNIAHGLYPRTPMSATARRRIVSWLLENVSLDDGRTYAGGLVKFEPSDLENILIPNWGPSARA